MYHYKLQSTSYTKYPNFNPADQELATAMAKMDAVFGNLYEFSELPARLGGNVS